MMNDILKRGRRCDTDVRSRMSWESRDGSARVVCSDPLLAGDIARYYTVEALRAMPLPTAGVGWTVLSRHRTRDAAVYAVSSLLLRIAAVEGFGG